MGLRTVAVGCAGLLAVSLGCAGLEDKVVQGVESGVAKVVEKTIEKSLKLPDDEVEVSKVGDRWKLETSKGDGTCGIGSDAKTPPKFPVSTGKELIMDCRVDADCKEIAGKNCPDGIGNQFDVALLAQGKASPKSLQTSRTKEMESKGWKVTANKVEGGTVMVATKGKKFKAASWVGTNDEGDTIEVVAAPAR